MNYKDFKFAQNGFKITVEKEVYFRTQTGKNWKTKPAEIYFEIVDNDYYNNYVNSIPFFNGFMGGTCRAQWGYTKAGYLPTIIATISPDKQEKHIARFYFD